MSQAPKNHARFRKRILVVDDEPEVALVILQILERAGFEASTISDPLKATAKASELRPDLIILDFDMPKLVGSELAVLLKSSPETRKTPIIFLSGMSDEDHHAIGAFSGAVAYLDKPVEDIKLIRTVRELVGPHEA